MARETLEMPDTPINIGPVLIYTGVESISEGGNNPTSRLSLIRQADNIEAGIFSVDYQVPHVDLDHNSSATAFVFRVESTGSQRYLMLVKSYRQES